MLSSHPFRRRLAVEALEDRTLLAVDMFLKISGIDGEVMDKGHKNEIEILSWHWGTMLSGGGGGGAGKVNVHDISVTKVQDSTSVELAQAAVSGKVYKKVEIHFEERDPNAPVAYYQYELKNVFISSYQIGGGGGGDPLPLESISMNFETIVTEYKTQDEKKVKGNSKDAYTLGPDINGDGQADPLYFNYARMADLDQDGILDLVVAANPDNPDTVVADLTGDGEPDLTQPGPLMVAVHRIGQPPEVRLALGDVNGDGLIDTAFAFDLDGDGLADTLAGLGA